MFMNLIEEIDKYAEYEEKIAHKYNGNIMTYKELSIKSDAIAAYIIEEFGIDKTPIIVYGHKQHEMLICFLACVKAGHPYVPIDSYLPEGRVNDIIASCEAKIIFSVSELDTDLQHTKIKTMDDIDRILEKFKGKKPSKLYRVKPDDTHYIIYTSGSTGKPKGVQISLSNLQSFTNWVLEMLQLDNEKNYVFMDQAPFSFDLSVMDLYPSLVSGSTLYSVDKEATSNMKELFKFFQESNINIWVSTPSFADMCLSDSKFNEELLPEVEFFLFCGETLTNSCVEKLHDRFKKSRVINSYGPTEATVAVTAVEVRREMNKLIKPLPVGYAKKDCNILILNKDNELVEEGKKGEIVILGDSVGKGYYNNPETTEKVFGKMAFYDDDKSFYRTGDEGYLDNGMLYYCGRIDYQIKLNGFRIEIEDIENNLRSLEIIKNAVVLPVFKNDKIQYLTAVVVLNKALEEKEFKIGVIIKNELKKLLPDYMVPRKINIREALPMTVNGKIDRKKLMEEFN